MAVFCQLSVSCLSVVCMQHTKRGADPDWKKMRVERAYICCVNEAHTESGELPAEVSSIYGRPP